MIQVEEAHLSSLVYGWTGRINAGHVIRQKDLRMNAEIH